MAQFKQDKRSVCLFPLTTGQFLFSKWGQMRSAVWKLCVNIQRSGITLWSQQVKWITLIIPSSGHLLVAEIYWAASEHVLKVDVVSNWSSKGPCGCRFSFQPSKNTPDLDQFKQEKMGKRKDLSMFDRGQIVMAGRLGQSISKTAALGVRSWSAVLSINQKWPRKGTVTNQQRGHGCPMLSNPTDELLLVKLLKS